MTDCAMVGLNNTSRILVLPLCACLLWSGGCFTQRRAAVHDAQWFAPRAAILPASAVVSLEEPPDISREVAALPPVLVGPHNSGPARPKVAPPPAVEPPAVEKKVEPSFAPELSTGELATAKIESYRSLEVAERNLGRTQGKTLNAAQQDLESKVRGFMESAREAMQNNDWSRAMNLAKKAEVLSEGLAAGN